MTLVQMFQQDTPVGGTGVCFLYRKTGHTLLVINQHSLCGHCPIPELLGVGKDELVALKPTQARMALPRKGNLATYDIPSFGGRIRSLCIQWSTVRGCALSSCGSGCETPAKRSCCRRAPRPARDHFGSPGE